MATVSALCLAFHDDGYWISRGNNRDTHQIDAESAHVGHAFGPVYRRSCADCKLISEYGCRCAKGKYTKIKMMSWTEDVMVPLSNKYVRGAVNDNVMVYHGGKITVFCNIRRPLGVHTTVEQMMTRDRISAKYVVRIDTEDPLPYMIAMVLCIRGIKYRSVRLNHNTINEMRVEIPTCRLVDNQITFTDVPVNTDMHPASCTPVFDGTDVQTAESRVVCAVAEVPTDPFSALAEHISRCRTTYDIAVHLRDEALAREARLRALKDQLCAELSRPIE